MKKDIIGLKLEEEFENDFYGDEDEYIDDDNENLDYDDNKDDEYLNHDDEYDDEKKSNSFCTCCGERPGQIETDDGCLCEDCYEDQYGGYLD